VFVDPHDGGNGRVMRAAWLTALALTLSVSGSLRAADWPQFRGPGGQGHSMDIGLPLSWSESENVVWKVPVAGTGWSSPVVAGGKIWLTTVVEPGDGNRRGQRNASLRALAFDVATGREVVNVEVFRGSAVPNLNPKNSRASPTPIVDGEQVYVHFGAEGTAALSTTGEILWTTHLRYESQHGNGGSPVLYRDLLIVSCDGGSGDAYVIALDTKTGKTRWRTNRRAPADQAYATPLVIRVGGRDGDEVGARGSDQVVAPGAYRVAAYDPLTGSEIWRVSYDDGFSNVPRPVYGNGLVYIATGFNAPTLIAVRPDGRGDVTRTHVAWTVSRGAPLTPSPLLVGDFLYYVSDTGVLSLTEAKTGGILWQQRLGGNYSASPVLADGKIYFQSEEGVTTVIAPGREFRRLAVNRLDGAMLASMAVSDGALVIRTDRHLYRIGVPSP
jgi:outer membrane protein assembly factor BamB